MLGSWSAIGVELRLLLPLVCSSCSIWSTSRYLNLLGFGDRPVESGYFFVQVGRRVRLVTSIHGPNSTSSSLAGCRLTLLSVVLVMLIALKAASWVVVDGTFGALNLQASFRRSILPHRK